MGRILVVVHCILLASLIAHSAPASAGDPGPRLGARARLLRQEALDRKSLLGAETLIPISIRLSENISVEQLARLRAAGAIFYEAPTRSAKQPANSPRRGVVAGPEGEILGGSTVIPARVAPRALDALAQVDGVLRVESAWRPRRIPPLYQTRALSGVDEAWQVSVGNGEFLDGQGVLLADIDTGVDLTHPDFWFADGGVFDWIDVDDSGDLSNGDVVDLNGNGLPDAGELLRYWDAPGNAPLLEPGFQTRIDHLYGDENDNSVRDHGAPTYNDADPCFGEPFYRANDANLNGLLDPGETLDALSSCKVLAVYQNDDIVRTLGVDLILNQGDTYGHGTNVGSILVGGEKGRDYAGFAPGAQMVFGNLGYTAEHPFVTPLDVRMAWAAAEGADIFVYEDGEWIWEFLDGSSNVEILMNELAAQGSIHVAAAGNLATGGMHWEGTLGGAVLDSIDTYLDVTSPDGTDIGVVWGDFYYRAEVTDKAWVFMETPTGERMELYGPGRPGGTITVGNFEIYSAEDRSPRGTSRVDFRLEAIVKGPAGTKALDGSWRFVMLRDYATSLPKRQGEIEMNAMCWDDLSGWYGFSRWQNASTSGTVTWPGTADSSITVAAYSPQNSVDGPSPPA